MINSICLTWLVLINAFFHLTHAHSYSQSYRGNGDQGYPESSVTNFGNGNNKRNFVNIDETSDRTSISGTSFTNDNNGRPSVEKLNVDIKNNRGESHGPNVNLNPRATRTHVTNIGNGVGNRNLFVFNDNSPDQAYPRNNQDNNYDYRGQQNNGYQGRPRVITNIGHGPDNDNQIYVNGKKVFPNAVNKNGVQDPSVIRESLPPIRSDGQIPQNQGAVPNDNFMKPNDVTRNHRTDHQASTFNGYSKTPYPHYNYNQVKIINSNIGDGFDDPSFKVLPMRA